MKGSEFAAQFGPRGPSAWEGAALQLARDGQLVQWPWKPVSYNVDGHNVTVFVTSDYLAVGEPGDILRLPLTPTTAQRIANLQGLLLPTPKLVLETWRAADVKTAPQGIVPNKGADMTQFTQHNATLEGQLAGTVPDALRSGLKKDIVVGNLWKPGKVLIYGWMQQTAPMTGKDPAPKMTESWRVQPYSNVHGDFYFDYSHGARFVSSTMMVDGQQYDTEQVYTNPQLAYLVSDEGPVKMSRYPAPGDPKPSALATALVPTAPGYAPYGLYLVREGKVS
jgi:hypothetical protein